MPTTPFTHLHSRNWILLFPWKLAKNPKSRDSEKICRSIWFNFSGGLAAKSQCFMVKLSPKVRISIFPWQPFWISKFRQRKLPLWLRQIVRAQFRYNRLKNRRVVSKRKSVRDCLHVCPRLPACVFSQITRSLIVGRPPWFYQAILL